MDSTMKESKHHVVCMPFPAQGHINAMLHLAKVLHSKGFHITFVNTEFNHRRLLDDGGPASLDGRQDFRFATIPDGLPPSDSRTNQGITALCVSTQRTCATPFRNLLTALNDPSSGVPPVSCVISDAITSFTLAATADMAIPTVFYSSVSACSFMGIFYCKELMERGIIPLKCEEDLTSGCLNTTIDWIPGMTKLRLQDLSSFGLDKILLNFSKDEVQASCRATAVIFNTFHDLEGPVIDALSSILPPVYDIGPVSLLSQHISSTSIGRLNLWKDDSSCMKWLEEKEPGTVLYVNFGSIIVLTSEQLTEFAWGLANSGYEFLWVIRPDLVAGEIAILPQEFFAETKGRSFLTGWCSQEEVLSHVAIGGFLTHCGWNSTMESMCAGVPMICWPFIGDQRTNCKYICSEWEIGMEIGDDVKRAKVEMLIKEMMGGQRGKEMKRKVLEWKERAIEAVRPGGSSSTNLERFIEGIIKKKIPL